VVILVVVDCRSCDCRGTHGTRCWSRPFGSCRLITIQQLSEVTSFLSNANNSFNVLPLQGNNSLQNMHTTTSNVIFGDVSPATVTNSSLSGSGYNISGSQSNCISSINVQNTVTNLPLSVSNNNKDSMSVSLQQVLPLGSTICK